jgi:hypothetical protein
MHEAQSTAESFVVSSRYISGAGDLPVAGLGGHGDTPRQKGSACPHSSGPGRSVPARSAWVQATRTTCLAARTLTSPRSTARVTGASASADGGLGAAQFGAWDVGVKCPGCISQSVAAAVACGGDAGGGLGVRVTFRLSGAVCDSGRRGVVEPNRDVVAKLAR